MPRPEKNDEILNKVGIVGIPFSKGQVSLFYLFINLFMHLFQIFKSTLLKILIW